MHSEAQKPSVVIVGTIRNGTRSLIRDIKRLDAATAGFGRRTYFVVESDSSDGTVRMLEALSAKRSDFNFRSFGQLASEMPLRTQRLAFCRNACIEFVFTSPERHDFVLVADLDNINDGINEEGLMSCFAIDQKWDVCTANRFGRYYDVFALRCDDWVEDDCFAALDRLGQKLDRAVARKLLVEGKMITIPPEHPAIEVKSAFAGLALYRQEVYVSSRYEGLTADGREVCEHVAFHAGITSNGGKILINPRMQAGGRPEFGGKNLLRMLFRRA
ncbi:hypothetical protein [Chthonobacter albigriseus]|uniref:hypothetical protein n=1 Tax=Chthonobacter albigriseus TaxID=1683161 RepID=UPI0015EEE6C7|nr:hypothetical protein [Chthonobacter albigriseus]